MRDVILMKTNIQWPMSTVSVRINNEFDQLERKMSHESPIISQLTMSNHVIIRTLGELI